MIERVSLRLRKCTRCGHWECPCCVGMCDEGFNAEDELCGCSDIDGNCTYLEPLDEDGFGRLSIAVEAARKRSRTGVVGIGSAKDGVIEVDDDEGDE